jgi:preprotein translocase subunit SecG
MNSKKAMIILMVIFFICSIAVAQMADKGSDQTMKQWYGVIEIPFLLLAVVLSIMTAYEFKGGALGKGMMFLAIGLLVMAVGHIHMQLQKFLNFDIFDLLFGKIGGNIAWVIALIITWGCTAYGFYSLYKAGKSK